MVKHPSGNITNQKQKSYFRNKNEKIFLFPGIDEQPLHPKKNY